MIVKSQKPIQFNNKCGCIVDYFELEKAILWYSNKPVARLKTIFMHGQYPAVSIYQEKIHVHRLLMMYWENRILDRTEQVHHKNENKLDSSRRNLEIIKEGFHQSIHNKGKILSITHKEKISIANKKRRGMKMKRRVNIPINELRKLLAKGYSLRFIARKYNFDPSTVKSRIYENPSLLEVSRE